MQKIQQQRLENENVKAAMGDLAFLISWVARNPQIAGQLALETHDLARRYIEESPPSAEFRAVIPVVVWQKFVASCCVAEATVLSEEACYEKLQELLFRAMNAFIIEYSHE